MSTHSLEHDKLNRLGDVVRRTDAKIVLSTDWRRDPSLKAKCINALAEHGCTVIGATRKGSPLQPIRPKEIWGWLQSYQNDRGKHVTAWAAIDDRALLMEQGGEHLKGHFVGTNFATGLTDRCAERLIQVLSGNLEEGMGMQSKLNTLPRSGSPARGKRAKSPSRSKLLNSAEDTQHRVLSQSLTKGEMTLAAAMPEGARHGLNGVQFSLRAMSTESPARARVSGMRTSDRARSSKMAAGADARNAAFGGAKTGLHSPTFAQKSVPAARLAVSSTRPSCYMSRETV